MLEVNTRQNKHGNWWCNTTHNCYDLFEEASTPEEAQELMKITLRKRKCEDTLHFTPPKWYGKTDEVNKKLNAAMSVINTAPIIGYRKNRIDTNPQG